MKAFDHITTRLLSAGFLAALALPAWAAEQTYALDPTHTQVQANWNHLGFSNPGAAFSIKEGTLIWNDENPLDSSVTVTIPVNSVDTRVPMLDETMRTEYFKAGEFPDITFESTGATRVGQSDDYRITGDLTMHGVTRPVVLDATLNHMGEHPMLETPAIGFDATTTIRRSEFGLDAEVPFVSDEVTITITGEAVDPEALEGFLEMIEYAPDWD